jgi:hypothetical protein
MSRTAALCFALALLPAMSGAKPAPPGKFLDPYATTPAVKAAKKSPSAKGPKTEAAKKKTSGSEAEKSASTKGPASKGAAPNAEPQTPGASEEKSASKGRSVAPPLPSSKADEISFVGVGDVMMGSTFPDETGGGLPPDDGAKLLSEVAPILGAADIAFGNLEGPLLEGGTSEKCKNSQPGRCYAFRVPTRYGQYLKDAGFDVMSLANNHALDFGLDGRESSKKVLDGLGIAHSGEVGDIARLTVKGKKVSLIAFATYKASYNLNDQEAAVKAVSDEASKADLVIVSFHGGAEGASKQRVPEGHEMFLGEDRGDLRSFSHAVIDAGADLVIGHGPHVVRGLEVYQERLIAYSLGNFATYGGFNLKGPAGLSLLLEVKLGLDGRFLGGQIHPAKQTRPGGPKLDPTGEVIDSLQTLSKDDFGSKAPTIRADGSFSAP